MTNSLVLSREPNAPRNGHGGRQTWQSTRETGDVFSRLHPILALFREFYLLDEIDVCQPPWKQQLSPQAHATPPERSDCLRPRPMLRLAHLLRQACFRVY